MRYLPKTWNQVLYPLGIVLGLCFNCLLEVSGAYGSDRQPSAENGGTLTGTVKLRGEKPEPRGFNLLRFPDPIYCGRISTGSGWRLVREFTIDERNGVKDAVVMLTGVNGDKPFTPEQPQIEASDCQLKPFVTVLQDHGTLELVNMDPVSHEIQAYETSELGPRVLFDAPLPVSPDHPPTARNDAMYREHIAGESKTQTMRMTKGRRIVFLQCGIHTFMESWGLVVDNPYYALTDQTGQFKIDHIPPGTYKVLVWHPRARSVIEQAVTIPVNGVASANFEVQPRDHLPSEMDVGAISPQTPGLREIKPTLELQQR